MLSYSSDRKKELVKFKKPTYVILDVILATKYYCNYYLSHSRLTHLKCSQSWII